MAPYAFCEIIASFYSVGGMMFNAFDDTLFSIISGSHAHTLTRPDAGHVELAPNTCPVQKPTTRMMNMLTA